MVKDGPVGGSNGMPVVMPAWMDRWFFRYANPVLRRAARYLPAGVSVVEHRGRKSGKAYETPVTTYRNGKLLAIALGHGKADWVKNVLAAGEADVRLFRRTVHVTNLRVVPVGAAAADEPLSWMMRRAGRRAALLLGDID